MWILIGWLARKSEANDSVLFWCLCMCVCVGGGLCGAWISLINYYCIFLILDALNIVVFCKSFFSPPKKEEITSSFKNTSAILKLFFPVNCILGQD